jgi:hypothetical protein
MLQNAAALFAEKDLNRVGLPAHDFGQLQTASSDQHHFRHQLCAGVHNFPPELDCVRNRTIPDDVPAASGILEVTVLSADLHQHHQQLPIFGAHASPLHQVVDRERCRAGAKRNQSARRITGGQRVDKRTVRAIKLPPPVD